MHNYAEASNDPSITHSYVFHAAYTAQGHSGLEKQLNTNVQIYVTYARIVFMWIWSP